MAENKRDIELRIAATTSGSDAIRKLAEQVDQLAKEGGAAAPEFKKLGDELSRIGEQGNAVQALDRIEQEVEATNRSLFDAVARLNDFGRALEEQRARTEQFRDSQSLARAALDGTNVEIRRVEADLRTLNATTDRSGKATIGYKEESQRLRTELAQLRNTQAEQRAALEQANRAYSEQARALRSVTRDYNSATREVRALDTALAGQSAAIDKTKQSLNDLGVETTDAASALQQVETALAQTTAQVNSTRSAIDGYALVVEEARRAEEEWAREKAFAEKAAEANRLVQARQYVEFWEQALNEAEAAERRLAEQTERTAAAQRELNDAFAKTGVRSAQAIQAEIDEIVRSLAALRTNASVSGDEFDRAFAGAQRRLQALQTELAQTPGAIRNAGRETNLLVEGFRQLAAVYGGIELATKFIDANRQIETLRRSLALVTGSIDGANRAITLLRDTANNAGISVGEISNSFIKFRASLDGANVPLETTEGLFRAVVNASGQLGLSSEKTSLILEALAQTANKGVVSMEELRQQLGDSLPGALDLTAKGLGISTAELVKLTENGRLLSADFLPALRTALVEAYGDGAEAIDSFAAAWNRFKNILSETSQIVGTDGGFLDILGDRIDELGSAVRATTAGIDFLLQSVKILNEGSQNLDLTSPFSSGQEARQRLIDQFDILKQRLSGAKDEAEANTEAQQNNAAAAGENATAQQQLADATGSVAQAVSTATQGWAQLAVQYEILTSEAEAQISVAEKLAAAKKIETEARVALVEISGDEAAIKREQAAAAREETDALALVAERRQAEVDILVRQRDELTALAATLGDPGGQRAKEIEGINASIAAREAETEKAQQAAEASRLDAAAKALAVQTYRDNAAAVDSLRVAYDAARQALIATQAAQSQGLATAQQLADAQLRLSQAEALYRDAVSDSAAALDRKTRAAQGALTVSEAQISLERERITTELQAAQATGSSLQILQSTIALKQLDIRLLQSKIAALRIEAQALRDQAAAELAALQANDPLLEQKRAEIQLRLQNAKAKELEAQRNLEVIRQIDAEIDRLQRRGAVSKGTADQFVRDRDREVDALNRVADASERAGSAERSRYQEDLLRQQGGPVDNSYIFQLRDRLNRGESFSQSELPAIENALRVAIDNANAISSSSVTSLTGQRDAAQWVAVLTRVAERARASVTSDQAMSSAATGSYTVNINMGGQSTQINTASQADANALTALLQQIANAANRTGP